MMDKQALWDKCVGGLQGVTDSGSVHISGHAALLIADEPTSMLDPSGKANLLRMLKGLQNSRGFSMLMITHDLDAALKISDRIFLLEGGKLRRLDPNEHIRVDFDRLFDAG